MALNMTRLATGSGVDYLLSTVANGDVSLARKDFLEYYDAAGTPAGRWMGAGLEGLGLSEHDVVTANQAHFVFKKFLAPDASFELGNPPRSEGSVAGFDFTFTIPKSVSVLWAIADYETQQAIMAAHEQAIEDTIAWVERMAAHTRSGKDGHQLDVVKGLVAARYHHWDSREGDPHLHSHVVVLNKAQRASDGAWRTLDSKALYKATVAASEIHSNLILDELHRRLGLKFVEKDTGSRAVVMDIDGVPREVVDLFSTRAAAISEMRENDKAAWEQATGRTMTTRGVAALDESVWKVTRAAKSKAPVSLTHLRKRWRDALHGTRHRADDVLADVLGKSVEPTVGVTSDRLHDEVSRLVIDGKVDDLAQRVERSLIRSQTTWTTANIRAEVERMTRGVRCESAAARERMAQGIVDVTIERCVLLTGGDASRDVWLAPTNYVPPRVENFDQVFTSTTILDAESTIVELARHHSATAVAGVVAERHLARHSASQVAAKGFSLADDQVAAACAVLTSEVMLNAIVGPAGTGKTSTMSAIKSVWEQVYGEGMVVGLTTSSQAASVLGAELESTTHTVAKWLYESLGQGARRRADQLRHLHATLAATTDAAASHMIRRQLARVVAQHDAWSIKPGQLVILDEASMTGTLDIATIGEQVAASGGRLLLVGDPAQLDAVEAGGALGLLDAEGLTNHLTSVWRFKNVWEAEASLQLRAGSAEGLDEYEAAGRFENGATSEMLEGAFMAARADQHAGRSTIVVASTNKAVRDLNERFMVERRAVGEVDGTVTFPVTGGLDAGVGECVVSRKVDRTIRDEHGDFIRNGTQLVVEDINGARVQARRVDTGARIDVPTVWASEHVDLGYAITAHRAQGTTVDAAHVVIPDDAHMTRELLYVSMTRGRESNKAWVGVEAHAHDPHADLAGMTPQVSWRERLGTILATQGRVTSATEADRRGDARTTLEGRPAYEHVTRQSPGFLGM